MKMLESILVGLYCALRGSPYGIRTQQNMIWKSSGCISKIFSGEILV